MKTVLVCFPGSDRTYSYKTDFTLSPGDRVIVNPRGEEKIVTVITVEKKINPIATAWILRKLEGT